MVLSIAVVWSCGAIATAAGAYNNASADTQKYCRTDQVACPHLTLVMLDLKTLGSSRRHHMVLSG